MVIQLKEKSIAELNNNAMLTKARKFASDDMGIEIDEFVNRVNHCLDEFVQKEKSIDDKSTDELLKGYLSFVENAEQQVIREYNQIKDKKEKKYSELILRIKEAREKAFNQTTYESIVIELDNLGKYRDVCELSIEVNAEKNYLIAQEKMRSGNIEGLESAMKYFRQAGGYKDAEEKYNKCAVAIEKEKERKNIEILKKKKKKKIIIIAICSMVFLITALTVLLIVYVIIPSNTYSEAFTAYQNGEYSRAKELFDTLGNYKDSKEQADNCARLKKLDDIVDEIKNLDDRRVHNLTQLYSDVNEYDIEKKYSGLLENEMFEFMIKLNGLWECMNGQLLDMHTMNHIPGIDLFFDEGKVTITDKENSSSTVTNVYYLDGEYFLYFQDRDNYKKIIADGTSLRIEISLSSSNEYIKGILDRTE